MEFDKRKGRVLAITYKKVDKLKEEMEAKRTQLDILMKQTTYDLWNIDLDAFIAEWEVMVFMA